MQQKNVSGRRRHRGNRVFDAAQQVARLDRVMRIGGRIFLIVICEMMARQVTLVGAGALASKRGCTYSRSRSRWTRSQTAFAKSLRCNWTSVLLHHGTCPNVSYFRSTLKSRWSRTGQIPRYRALGAPAVVGKRNLRWNPGRTLLLSIAHRRQAARYHYHRWIRASVKPNTSALKIWPRWQFFY